MKKILSSFVAIVISISAISQTIGEKLDQYFSAAQKAGIFNGSVMITKGDEVLVNKGYGYKNIEAKTFNDENTVYQIGSVTKQFTAAIILRLVEKNKLSLSDKLSKFFPAYKGADKITIENLLSHTSGIYNYTNDANFMQHEVGKSFSEQQLFKLIKDKPLDFEPGSRYKYSNSGYSILGYIIEKVTGKKYEQVVREEIFAPLNMFQSGFDFTNLNDEHKATGYYIIEGITGRKAITVDSTVSFSAGAIYSTLSDMHKWNNSLATNKILKKASITNAFKARKSNYGLGWGIDSIEGKRRIAHDGGIHGFLSHNSIVPSDNLSITILSNAGNSKMDKVSKDVYDILYNKPVTLPEAKKQVTVDTSILAKYVGEYQIAPTFAITIRLVNGMLKAQATGQPEFDLYASSDTTFFLKVVDAQVEFVKNEKGEVEKLILHQGGQHNPGKKVK